MTASADRRSTACDIRPSSRSRLASTYLGRCIAFSSTSRTASGKAGACFPKAGSRPPRRRRARAPTPPGFAYYRRRPWGHFLASGRIYYKDMWWGCRIDERRHDYFAMGVLGQHVYVSPDTDTVIVRLSDRFPPGVWWPPLFRRIAQAVAASDG